MPPPAEGRGRRWPAVLAVLVALVVPVLLAGCDGGGGDVTVEPPEGWQVVGPTADVAFAVPPDARPGDGRPIDSAVGVLDGDGYRVTYDVGRFGEDLDGYVDAEGYRSSRVEVAGRSGREVAFVPTDEPFGWARVLQVDLGGGRSLTLRVSCADEPGCGFADDVFASVIAS